VGLFYKAPEPTGATDAAILCTDHMPIRNLPAVYDKTIQ